MKTFALILWTVQNLMAISMLIAAAVETESILVTGPIIVAVGLLLGLATRSLQSWAVLGFALFAPLACAFIAFLIAAYRMGPREGHAPTLVILSANLILSAPLAILSWRRISSWDATHTGRRLATLQFSLKSLLIVMTATCIIIAAAKMGVDYLGHNERLIFGGFTFTVLVLCGIVIWRCLDYSSPEDGS